MITKPAYHDNFCRCRTCKPPIPADAIDIRVNRICIAAAGLGIVAAVLAFSLLVA